MLNSRSVGSIPHMSITLFTYLTSSPGLPVRNIRGSRQIFRNSASLVQNNLEFSERKEGSEAKQRKETHLTWSCRLRFQMMEKRPVFRVRRCGRRGFRTRNSQHSAISVLALTKQFIGLAPAQPYNNHLPHACTAGSSTPDVLRLAGAAANGWICTCSVATGLSIFPTNGWFISKSKPKYPLRKSYSLWPLIPIFIWMYLDTKICLDTFI
jgi:hypothetical protein